MKAIVNGEPPFEISRYELLEPDGIILYENYPGVYRTCHRSEVTIEGDTNEQGD